MGQHIANDVQLGRLLKSRFDEQKYNQLIQTVLYFCSTPKEKGAYNIAAAYKDKMQVIFKRASGTDFAVKVAYENDIQEELIDFWNLPGGNGEVNEPIEVSDDPLDNLVANFGEIVENVDESEFMEYDSSKDNFSQSSLDDNNDEDDDNVSEEFLEGKELPSEDDNN